MAKQVEFTPVECGDMSEIPPDAPAGSWEGLCSVKKHKTAKDGFPMLILEWTLEKAHEDENEAFVGARVTDFVTFFPSSHKGCRMSRTRLKELCAGLKIDPPAVATLKTWDDISDFVDALDGCRAQLYTTVAPDKGTGEMRTSVRYQPPPGYSASGGGSGDDEEEEEAPPPTPKAKKTKGTTKAKA